MVGNGRIFDRYRVASVNFARYISVTVDLDHYILCNGWYHPVQGDPRTSKPSDRYVPPIQGGLDDAVGAHPEFARTSSKVSGRSLGTRQEIIEEDRETRCRECRRLLDYRSEVVN
ncbi:hypothetical protein B296_00048414 [Ensete ventricosum]|uniref:Uncharacterized protein n=1 Tax=Ensete ventricosum TaxID=4639 RepID=A0A426Y489_ENSVE|nr:hypothetical protein B296_00048414 [Ensete ventricosum]